MQIILCLFASTTSAMQTILDVYVMSIIIIIIIIRSSSSSSSKYQIYIKLILTKCSEALSHRDRYALWLIAYLHNK